MIVSPSFKAVGKEVLFKGWHFADACNERAAVSIAEALNNRPPTLDEFLQVPCDVCKEVGKHAPTCENGRKKT